jgi:polar amino acid transport system ATP-binding protein
VSSNIVVRVEDLHKRYGNEEILKGVSFTVRQGEALAIIGPSGTGKSTLLRCINRLTEPDRGRIFLEDTEITSPHVDINKIRQQIGFVFQDFNLFAHLTALDNVRLGLMKVKGFSKKEATERAMHELARVGLAEKAHAYRDSLSARARLRE